MAIRILCTAATLMIVGCSPEASQTPSPAQTSSPAQAPVVGIDNDERLGQIDDLYLAGDYESARDQIQSYLREFPRSAEGWTLSGWTFISLDQLDDAISSFQKALECDPSHHNAYVGLGSAHRRQEKYERAREYFQKAIELFPDNAEAYGSLVDVEIAEENYDRAVECGERAWACRKDLPTIPANLAVAYHFSGNKAKRDEMVQHAKRLGYHNIPALLELFSENP